MGRMMAKKKEDPGIVCGQCAYWHQVKEAKEPIGECYFNPPGLLVEDGEYTLIHPVLEPDYRGCGQFKGKQ